MKEALCILDLPNFLSIIDDENKFIETKLISREICEKPENNLIQIIPYTVFYSLDFENGKLNYLVYKRAKKINEERLVDKMSNGFGGHIDKIEDIVATEYITNEDSKISFKMNRENFIDTCLKAASREINEELNMNINIEEINKNNIILFFGDQNEDVNKVHLGVLISIKLPLEELQELKNKKDFNKEEIESLDILSINFKDVVETYNIEQVVKSINNTLKNNNYESWSQVTIEYILRTEYNALVSKTSYNDYVENYNKINRNLN